MNQLPTAKPSGKPPSRHDPKTRHIDATFPGTVLLNRDPDREYVWAYRAGQDTGLQKYLEDGWRIERQEDPSKSKDCLQLKQGITVAFGNEITWRGAVLVSKAKAEVAKLRREGVDGQGGRQEFDAIMQDFRKRGIVPNDPMFAAVRAAGAGSFIPPEYMGAENANFNETRETPVRERS